VKPRTVASDVPEIRLPLLVTPRAGANEVGPVEDGRLRVRVTAAPTGGEANEAVVRVVGEALGIPSRDVRLVAGGASRRKIVSVTGLRGELIERRFPGLTRGRGR
jgi:uncharacterized protein YggU (UPF0235/DUF167 family)